ncbi:hypothetical protein LEP1GSC188_2872 [Leptospira weilii serovar Topaz str. LT2116]|uniref:Uncharacterized protein n=1 Tax=Leptospira weilii serovar Topaz str. LT2116 TaxID=1088540 RepID=M3FQY2_9LEPT|nr:hypothetical protein LEP1GSC188_2872 [Leptospira weilii serovar Topaz str. LT2116]
MFEGSHRSSTQPSMTEENHCYESSIAKRINKTLKLKFRIRVTKYF